MAAAIAKDKVGNIMGAAKERIDMRTGANLASNIKASDFTQAKQDSFTGDSLGAVKNNSLTVILSL